MLENPRRSGLWIEFHNWEVIGLHLKNFSVALPPAHYNILSQRRVQKRFGFDIVVATNKKKGDRQIILEKLSGIGYSQRVCSAENHEEGRLWPVSHG